MYVIALQADLRFPSCRSLKEKRSLLKPIIDGARARFDVSVAEVAHHDSWQRAGIGFALVSGDIGVVERLADQIERFVWASPDIEVLACERNWLELETDIR